MLLTCDLAVRGSRRPAFVELDDASRGFRPRPGRTRSGASEAFTTGSIRRPTGRRPRGPSTVEARLQRADARPEGIRWPYGRRGATAAAPATSTAHGDITERKRAEEALQEADRRKDEFLATLAHELRNPLAPIRNALHLMRAADRRRPGLEAERAMAERQVVHLARLVDDLMDVARISRGKIELRKEVVDLATVVRQAVETARP